MKKAVFAVVALLMLASPAIFAQQKPVKLVFTSVSVPGDAHTQAMFVFKDEVEKLSGGQIQVDVYHSGQLFTQQAEQDAIRKGTVDMVYTSAQWLAEFIPYLSMFGAAYTFQSYDQMTKTFNGPIGKKIFEEVAQKTGIRPLVAYYLGTRQLNLTAKVGPITRPEQMKGVKLRVPNSPTWIAMGKALGANPTPMAFNEVYMGLKTGAIEGQDNPLPTDKNAKFYEVTKYIVLTNHVVDSTWPSINEKKWQSLTKEQQGWLMQAAEKARQFCDKTNLDNEKNILDFFRQQGLTVIENPDRAAFAAYAKNSYLTESKDISKDWDLNLYEEIQKLK
ncbi:MAG: sialic acid TRAP transporter substrate-binding protein SiaP [Spirochaetia bacterium]|jgi:tripartite ATP-independent transporter DctP family solute receptor|uniref:DctP family TRAP transporter solute receptor n=2 Tax=Spirochaetales TaxID=136 RepID=A0A3P3XIM1_9SPIR|nr:sialic acid TRAP transporter substrate-binding protein SiaP [Rectinema subterraneum]MDQ7796884.1 sialic acid TRAP transporter substrate-binding protein SiaP [Spirochaetia bacterium]SLM12833.1 DctP family TRAP transporter solute receptor [uncultured spirochete]HBE46550.1 C4-dicarboxylate ABC transporter substrate-binding protein [Spirochaetaceae bacterium]HCX95388.1 C4-dicarboxylate ABC transporter substrate-binding protein [Spirochaetaceae bacterium]